jgi:hypothetical protein
VLSYETLDAIADSYNPALLAISLAAIPIGRREGRWRRIGVRVAALGVVALLVYGLMFLDRRLDIWGAFGLDYSTHTALSLGLVIFLSFNARKLTVVWVGSFACYVLLMLYQRYHTIADIVTTGLVVGVPAALTMAYLTRRAASVPDR